MKIKKSIVSLNNTDNVCLLRVIVAALSLLEKNENDEKSKEHVIMRNGKPVEREMALC